MISIISKVFYVKKNENVEAVYNMLPGYNCGACGKAGCMALAEEILANSQSVNKCKPIKQNEKENILEYMHSINK